MRSVLRILLIPWLVLWPIFANAMPTARSVPGGVVILNLGESEEAPRARFMDDPVVVLRVDSAWIALVGLPLSLETGQHRVEVLWPNGGKSRQEFHVHHRPYSESRITISEQKLASPGPEDLERIAEERLQIREALNTWTPDPPDVDFDVPAKGRFSSGFGLRRFINNTPRNPHSGLDIAAPPGTPIYAPAAGRVILTGEFFYAGKAVFLHHGQALISFYAHMNEIGVRTGQTLQRGEEIGSIGMTGRVTGPHLHWSIYLNRTAVDPELFLAR